MLGGKPRLEQGNSGSQQRIEIPPLRTWNVTRVNPDTDEIETIEVQAHSVEYNEAGLAFQQAHLHETGQVIVQLRRGFAAGMWLEFEETTPIPVAPPLQSPSPLLIR